MRRILLTCAIVLAAPTGQAQTEFHKCVLGKQIVYQNQPCPPSQRTDKVIRYPPTFDSQAATRQRRQIQAEVDRRYAAQRESGWPVSMTRGYDGIDCRNARSRRHRQLKQIGTLRISSEQERDLCRPVQHACGYCSD